MDLKGIALVIGEGIPHALEKSTTYTANILAAWHNGNVHKARMLCDMLVDLDPHTAWLSALTTIGSGGPCLTPEQYETILTNDAVVAHEGLTFLWSLFRDANGKSTPDISWIAQCADMVYGEPHAIYERALTALLASSTQAFVLASHVSDGTSVAEPKPHHKDGDDTNGCGVCAMHATLTTLFGPESATPKADKFSVPTDEEIPANTVG